MKKILLALTIIIALLSIVNFFQYKQNKAYKEIAFDALLANAGNLATIRKLLNTRNDKKDVIEFISLLESDSLEKLIHNDALIMATIPKNDQNAYQELLKDLNSTSQTNPTPPID